MAGFKARVARHPQSRLKSGLALSRKRDGRPAKYPFPDGALNRLARQAEVLFTELAVLLFVFPALDTVVQGGGEQHFRVKIVYIGTGAAFVCYAIAMAIAVLRRGD